MKEPTETVSFRLAPEFMKILEEQAASEGKKRNDWARRLVIRALTETERSELKDDIETLKKDIRKMRGDFATLGQVLLVKVAKQNAAEVEAWIRQHFTP